MNSSNMQSPEVLFCGSCDGIYRLVVKQGNLTEKVKCADGSSYFLAIHPSQPVLYSIDQPGSKLFAFEISPDELRLIGEVPIKASIPAHLAIDPPGNCLAVAGYGGGIEIFLIDSAGRPHQSIGYHLPQGTGPHPHQEKSHPHGIAWQEKMLYLADLGSDQILGFSISSIGDITPLPSHTISLLSGAGPRHVIFHPHQPHGLVINELNNTLVGLTRGERVADWISVNAVSTLPAGFVSESWAAETVYHPQLNICYASNRGSDSIAVFSFHPESGHLDLVGHFAAGGSFPQHLMLDTSGTHLWVANFGSNSLCQFNLDPRTGTPPGQPTSHSIPEPTCLVQVPLSW